MKKLAILTILLVPFFSHAALPAFPMAFWGDVTINGSPAPSDTVIRAYYGATLAGQVVVNEVGIYGYNDSTKQKLLVSEGNGEITFTVQRSGEEETGDLIAVTHPAFASGETINKDLSFTISSGSGGSSGGGGGSSSGGGGGGGSSGGGGGGGGSTVPQTTSAGNIGDANNDGKTDIFDFNALMIQWGNTGTGHAADFNNDSVVDIFDFNSLMVHWTT